MLNGEHRHADINTNNRFDRIEYLSKHDIIDAVRNLHAHILRLYKVPVSDTGGFQQYVLMKVAFSWLALRLVDNSSVQTNLSHTLCH